MSLSKEQTEEVDSCMLQLTAIDREICEEMERSTDKRNEVRNFISEVIAAEDKFNSTFDNTEEGKVAFSKSVETMIEALAFETFKVEITGHETKKGRVTFTRDGKLFLPEIQLLTIQDTENATSKQAASIVIEIAIVLLLMAKVKDPLSEERFKKAIEELEPSMSKIKDALRNLAFTWKHNSDIKAHAAALLLFLKQIYHDGILTKCIIIIISNMGWIQRAKALGHIFMFIKRTCRHPKSLLKRIEAVLKEKAAGKLTEKIANLIKISECQEILDSNYIL